MKLSICSPVGGFGNHLRWLLLLSPEFDIQIKDITDKKIITQRMIYPKYRTCFNWINTEWRYREIMNKYISFTHNIEDEYDASVSNKIIAMTINPKYALKHYLKLNPLLNGHTVESFLDSISMNNNSNTEFRVNQEDKMLVINANKLYNAVLDKELYKSAIDFFEIGNVYEQANDVHQMWYELHQQANSDVLNVANSWTYSSNIEKPNSLNYKKTVETILTLYKNENTILHGS